MAEKMAKAVKLAIMQGGIKDLEWEDQWRVAKALQILEALPERFDEIKKTNK